MLRRITTLVTVIVVNLFDINLLLSLSVHSYNRLNNNMIECDSLRDKLSNFCVCRRTYVWTRPNRNRTGTRVVLFFQRPPETKWRALKHGHTRTQTRHWARALNDHARVNCGGGGLGYVRGHHTTEKNKDQCGGNRRWDEKKKIKKKTDRKYDE